MGIGHALLGRFFIVRQGQFQALLAGIVGNQRLRPIELGGTVAGIRRLLHVFVGLDLVAFDIAAFHQQKRIFEHRRRIAAGRRLAIPEGRRLRIALGAETARHHLGNQRLGRRVA
ncbi:hypothetical protein NRS6108_04609 [Bacillus subtilis]|nr:hypothetical protein NRS6108_04609 [Bacillus subtilis]